MASFQNKLYTVGDDPAPVNFDRYPQANSRISLPEVDRGGFELQRGESTGTDPEQRCVLL